MDPPVPPQANIQRQSSEDSHSSMEEKLPEQIMEDVLLEGVDSSKLLQNADIVTFSNILANLRYDLAAILNEEIDEFQFQTICHDLLSKTSQSINIKPPKTPNKHQSQRPKPKPIDLNDIYSHLKRQNDTNNSNNTGNAPTAGSHGWNSYLSQVCNHDKRNHILIQNETETETETEIETETETETALAPGECKVCEEENDDLPLRHNNKITLMGSTSADNDSVIQFKTDHNETSNESDNELQINQASMHMTLMGHETIQ